MALDAELSCAMAAACLKKLKDTYIYIHNIFLAVLLPRLLNWNFCTSVGHFSIRSHSANTGTFQGTASRSVTVIDTLNILAGACVANNTETVN